MPFDVSPLKQTFWESRVKERLRVRRLIALAFVVLTVGAVVSPASATPIRDYEPSTKPIRDY